MLIPKENMSSTPSKYWPIALYNVLYKIITKIITNRLKSLLPSLISSKQIGYVEGCQILDRFILSHKVIHSLKISKKQGMLLKLDISKEFDKLNRVFMEKTLLTFGFYLSWIRWEIYLISTTFFSIILNGVPTKPFNPS